MSQLPQNLRDALGRGHARDDWPRLVAQLELFGVQVLVRRLQLGSMKREGFGQWKTVYQSPQPKETQAHD